MSAKNKLEMQLFTEFKAIYCSCTTEIKIVLYMSQILQTEIAFLPAKLIIKFFLLE